MIGVPNGCCILELRVNQCFVCDFLAVPMCKGQIFFSILILTNSVYCNGWESDCSESFNDERNFLNSLAKQQLDSDDADTLYVR